MLLQKMIIKNYRGIEKETIVDFSVSNKAKEKLSNNYMFQKEGKDLIPIIIGFIGKNASGKSSILNSLVDALDLVLEPKRHFTEFYSSEMNDGVLQTQDKQEKLNKKINKFRNYSFENQKELFPNIYKKFLHLMFMKYSNDQKNSVTINLFFKERNSHYNLGFKLEKNNLNLWKMKNDKKINDNFSLIEYKIILSQHFDSFYSDFSNQFDLLAEMGIKRYNNLLSMIDNNISEIIPIQEYPESKITYESIKMKNGSLIPFSYLSTGTKKLLNFVCEIVNITVESSNKSKIILIIIDEIDNSMHFKLIDFIFKLISHKINEQQLIFSTHSPLIIDLVNRHSAFYISMGENLKIEKLASSSREKNNTSKKFLNEEISSHPSTSDIYEILSNWK